MAASAEVKICMNTLHLVPFSRLGKSRNHDIHKLCMNAALANLSGIIQREVELFAAPKA